MSDAPDPPRKFFTLKPREFEVVNPPRPPAGQAGPDDQPIEVHDLFRSAAGTNTGKILAKNRDAASPNDVHGILRENLEKANAAGLNELAPKPRRKSRRTRDYIVMLLAGNLLAVCAIVYTRGNIVVLAYAGAGIIIFTLGLTWTMWFVMDDY